MHAVALPVQVRTRRLEVWHCLDTNHHTDARHDVNIDTMLIHAVRQPLEASDPFESASEDQGQGSVRKVPSLRVDTREDGQGGGGEADGDMVSPVSWNAMECVGAGLLPMLDPLAVNVRAGRGHGIPRHTMPCHGTHPPATANSARSQHTLLYTGSLLFRYQHPVGSLHGMDLHKCCHLGRTRVSATLGLLPGRGAVEQGRDLEPRHTRQRSKHRAPQRAPQKGTPSNPISPSDPPSPSPSRRGTYPWSILPAAISSSNSESNIHQRCTQTHNRSIRVNPPPTRHLLRTPHLRWCSPRSPSTSPLPTTPTSPLPHQEGLQQPLRLTPPDRKHRSPGIPHTRVPATAARKGAVGFASRCGGCLPTRKRS